MMNQCSVQDCDRPQRSKGLCNKHYQRLWNHGDPLMVKSNKGKPVDLRFMEKVSIVGECWEWTGTITRKGYGMFWPASKGMPAHRWSYERRYGPIPEGMQLDHLCRNRCCVNPDHLEPVTAKENQRRSPFDPAARTHCKHGHPYDEENTLVRPTGGRTCRACRRRVQAEYQRRRRSRS